MSSIASKLTSVLPDGNIKNNARRLGFRYLFSTYGHKQVLLGTSHDKVPAAIGKLLFTSESLGQREHNGYLKYCQLKPGQTIINAGAYHGYFAIYAAKKVGEKGQVICFEPEPNNLRLLKHNISLNNLSNVTVVPKGLWSTNTKLPLISMGSGSTINPGSSWRQQMTDVCSLDDELDQLNVKKIDLITMDIEGAEIEALPGAKQTILNNPQLHLAIASYHIVSGQPTHLTLEKIFSSYNMRTLTDYPPHLTTYAWHNYS